MRSLSGIFHIERRHNLSQKGKNGDSHYLRHRENAIFILSHIGVTRSTRDSSFCEMFLLTTTEFPITRWRQSTSWSWMPLAWAEKGRTTTTSPTGSAEAISGSCDVLWHDAIILQLRVWKSGHLVVFRVYFFACVCVALLCDIIGLRHHWALDCESWMP